MLTWLIDNYLFQLVGFIITLLGMMVCLIMVILLLIDKVNLTNCSVVVFCSSLVALSSSISIECWWVTTSMVIVSLLSLSEIYKEAS